MKIDRGLYTHFVCLCGFDVFNTQIAITIWMDALDVVGFSPLAPLFGVTCDFVVDSLLQQHSNVFDVGIQLHAWWIVTFP